MPEGYGQFIPTEAREKQFNAANFVVENESGDELLRPPSIDRETILNLSLGEVKEQFPKRYEMYVKLVRELKHPDNEDGPVNLTPEDVEDMKRWLLALNSVDNYIARHRSPKEGDEITLRGERQVDVFDDIRKFLERNGKEGYLKLPTGFGKTVLFTELVEATNLKTLVVVPTKLLIHQTADKFTKFAPNITVGKVYGDEKDFDQQTTIITYDSLINALKDGTLNPKDYDMVILDEAHVITAEGRAAAVAKFPDAVKIGFTATPVYKPGEKEVSNILGTEIHRLNIREAVEGNYLSSFTSIIARTEVDLSKVRVTSSGDFDQDQLDKAVNVLGRNKGAVDLYKTAFSGQMAVVYCVKIDHAQAVSDLFNEAGVSAACISGKTPDDEQERILADYKSGKIKVLCNADLLIAGFDEQQASVCINLRPTKSIVVAEQRGGRVLRIDENNPNKHAYIIDFVDQGVEKTGQVLFPQVAEAVELYPKGVESTGRGPRGPKGPPGPPVEFEQIVIEGIEVVVDQEMVLEILRKVSKEIKKDKYTYEQLKGVVRAFDVKPKFHKLKEAYIKLCESYPDLPKYHQLKDISGFTSLADLWGFEVVKTYEQLKTLVKASGIVPDRKQLGYSYAEARKIHTNWPHLGNLINKEDFVSLEDLWGFDMIRDYNKLKEAVQSSGIVPDPKNLIESYTEARKIHTNWPVSVWAMKDFVSLYDLWGIMKPSKVVGNFETPKTPEKIKNYSQLKNAVKASGINPDPRKLSKEYREAQKSNPTWPFFHTLSQMEGFVSMLDLWGLEIIKDYGVLKSKIQSSGIKPKFPRKLAESYVEAQKSNPTWPSYNVLKKMENFVGFEDLWGLERVLKDLDKLKFVIHNSGVVPNPKRLQESYEEIKKNIPTVPSYNLLVKLEGFKGLKDLFGIEEK